MLRVPLLSLFTPSLEIFPNLVDKSFVEHAGIFRAQTFGLQDAVFDFLYIGATMAGRAHLMLVHFVLENFAMIKSIIQPLGSFLRSGMNFLQHLKIILFGRGFLQSPKQIVFRPFFPTDMPVQILDDV